MLRTCNILPLNLGIQVLTCIFAPRNNKSNFQNFTNYEYSSIKTLRG